MVTTSPPSGPPAPAGAVEADSGGPAGRPAPVVRGPALVVLGIAVFIVVAGMVASALASGNTPPPVARSVTVGGTAVPLLPATVALRPIVGRGEPPADIIGSLAVPSASQRTGVVDIDQGQGQFDRTVSFTTRLSSDQVVEAYRVLLPRLGWRVIYAGPGSNRLGEPGTEVLAKRGSGDGFYWEVGLVASPTTPDGSTPFSIEVFELPDVT